MPRSEHEGSKPSLPCGEAGRRLDRRQLLALAGSGAALAVAGALPAHAATHASFKHGDVEVTIISDGNLVIPTRLLAMNADPKDVAAALATAGQSGETVSPPTNVTLLRRGTETILFDTGAGPNFMPTAGKLIDNMKAAGIDPRSVTKVIYTHAHPDHIWGTLDDFDEAPHFPAASYVIAAAEWNFWMADDVVSRLPVERQNFATGAKRNLAKIKERMRTVKPGEEIVSGISGIDTAGHTAGHMAIQVASAGTELVVLGDALTHAVISFAHPDWRPAADHHDAAAAALMRRRLLDRLAATNATVVGFHLPFPGVGKVRRRGAAWAFEPMA